MTERSQQQTVAFPLGLEQNYCRIYWEEQYLLFDLLIYWADIVFTHSIVHVIVVSGAGANFRHRGR